MNFYGKAIAKIQEFAEQGELTEEQWDLYAKLNGFFSAESVMWIHSETEDWNVFMENLKRKGY